MGRLENPQKLTQLSPRSHPRHFVGKRTAQKWHHHRHRHRQPGEQQFPIQMVTGYSNSFTTFFYLFLYLYITRIIINNNTPHLKSPKNQNRRAALGRPAMKLLGAWTSLRSTNPRLWFCFCSPDKTTTNNKNRTHKTQTKSKAGSWHWRAGGHNAKITYKTKRYNRHNRNETNQEKMEKNITERSQNRSAALARPAMKSLGASTSLRSTNPRP